MHVTVATLLALQCSLCLSIRVPVVWNNDNSEVNKFAVETIPLQNAPANQKPIPNEYFQYTAQKPKFAVDIAQFHGVQSPKNHYKAYPIKPHTGVAKPELGKHQLLDKENNNFLPYQEYVKKNEALRHVTPSTTSYEIFHPYKLEEAALKELYQDPVMDKIRNDLLNSKNRLQKYENEAGKPEIAKDEYLESPEETDRKKVPQKNVPAPYEIHRPQRLPVYYRHPAAHSHRENILNQKLRHPWHQNYVKIQPIHYRPVKNNLQRLRQQHALKYDDEQNEYPQVLPPEKYNEPSEGYDIFEKGKEKFVQLKNNVDESINEAIQKNRPIVEHKLELTKDEPNDDTTENNAEDEEEDFVPIKNYSQVRKTETIKHLPKEAAYHDADTLEEIQNAPRLREAVKSTKAQTVYSEEGYEDSAYDHGGEQKHASDHEAHGGFLKEKENSKGKFKIPQFSAKFEDGDESEYRDEILDGKKWKNNNKDTEEEIESNDYSEEDKELSDESDSYSTELNNNNIKEGNNINDRSLNEDNERTKREKTDSELTDDKNSTKTLEDSEHDVNKRETNIDVPEIDIDKIYVNEKEILNISKLIIAPKNDETDNTGEKYPYYFKKLKAINKNSPLRYAENLKFIPKKSEGGTEFYDSRSKYECPEIDDDIDPIPEKLKKDGHPDENEENTEDNEEDEAKKDKSDFSALEKNPRLRGLGDKIDCFKAKYFGENPLDSPFFKEELISNPEPVTVPSIDVYKLKQKKEQFAPESTLNEALDLSKELREKGKIDMFTLLDKLYPKQVIEMTTNKKNVSNSPILKEANLTSGNIILQSHLDPKYTQNIAHKVVQQQDVKNLPTISRKKRAAPFVYEPYKIIRDSQIQDSRKTTTTNNISPLIKQLQSSRVATNQGKEQVVKRNVSARTYKDIGKSDREKNAAKEKGSKPISDTSFVDVSIDQRRGEPRYELRPVNHKSHYTPVENKKSITKEDYKAQTNTDINSEDYDLIENKKKNNHGPRVTTTRPFFDVTKFLPSTENLGRKDRFGGKNEKEKRKVPQSRSDKSVQGSEEDDEEYDEDNYNKRSKITTTSSPSRKRILTSPTTSTPKDEDEDEAELPKLRLITRFNDAYETENPKTTPGRTEIPTTKVHESDAEINGPKYSEKKKKSRKSTLVTDTKSYGEDDEDGNDDEDDLRKKEVDALIGVNQDDKEYMPKYEKESLRKEGPSNSRSKSIEDKRYRERDHYHEDDDEDEDDEDDDDDEEDDDDDDEDEDDEEDENEEPERKIEVKPALTTPEPTKRTLVRTTEAPPTTTESPSARLEVKPVVVKKKFESHKELPVNRSSPHMSEFKQDIKEVEIIKELPVKMKKKPQKNIEALELYKDENLAKDVNKLGGVEIFKEGLDLVNGPKHGGNYRRAEDLRDDSAAWPSSRRDNKKSSASDAMASQSTSKLVEVRGDPYSRRRSDIERARKSRGRSAKLIELSDSTEGPTSRPMHGGNFKSIHEVRRGGRRGSGRNAKIVELDEHKSRNDQSSTHGSNSRSYGSRGGDRHQMHGGNYRSAKIIQADTKHKEPDIVESTTKTNKDSSADDKRNAAMILNTFASAVPVLETTPAYILDPSKRMYYYVDA